mmetsp:Transcript_49045/g.157065  ORF Transcript_49045/g.157065 Transcript_49045/m.157065 type:complete len:255 (+) Transcript_49045:103-867(+)
MAMGGHGGGAAPLRRWCGGAPDALLLFWWACAVVASLPLSPLPLAPGWARRAVRRCSARGKLWQDAAEGGRGLLSAALLDASVPQAWFSHFYLAGSAANAAVLAWVTARWEAGVSPSSDAEGRDLAGQVRGRASGGVSAGGEDARWGVCVWAAVLYSCPRLLGAQRATHGVRLQPGWAMGPGGTVGCLAGGHGAPRVAAVVAGGRAGAVPARVCAPERVPRDPSGPPPGHGVGVQAPPGRARLPRDSQRARGGR